MIFTFYSYKGGVGRSMALANVAEYLCRRGLRVAMVDWDLEAPGLETFFTQGAAEAARDIADHPGLMEMLAAYKRLFPRLSLPAAAPDGPPAPAPDGPPDAAPDGPPAAAAPETPAGGPPASTAILEVLNEQLSPLQGVLQTVPRPWGNPTGEGEILLLSAGWRSPEHLDDYVRAVQSFDWAEFYRSYQGEAYFNWLRAQLDAAADVVLVDSRTGVTEMGGVCTRQLADVVVAFCAPNNQNLHGVDNVIGSFHRKDLEQVRASRLEFIVVPARLDSSEISLRNAFEALFRQTLAEIPLALRDVKHDFWDLRIPYIAKYSYHEQLAVGVQDTARELADAYENLALHLALFAPEGSALRTRFGADLQRSFPELLPAVFVVCADQALRPQAQALCARIAEAGISTWKTVADLDSGDPQPLLSTIERARHIVLLLSPVAAARDAVRRVWYAARQRGVWVHLVAAAWPAGDTAASVLPTWAQGVQVHEPDGDQEGLLSLLRVRVAAPRVPQMAPPPPAGYVPRPAEHQAAVNLLLGGSQVVALCGLGGSGKTALAAEICRDEEVLAKFDGVLWVTLGRGDDVRRQLAAVYTALTGEEAQFESVDEAMPKLLAAISGRSCLLVLDDVREADAQDLGARGRWSDLPQLVTTRNRYVARRLGAEVVPVGSMTESEALQVLTATAADASPQAAGEPQAEAVRAAALALSRELGFLPLALRLANAYFRQELRSGDLAGSLDHLRAALAERGVVSFDDPGGADGGHSLARTLAECLDLLPRDSRQRFLALAAAPRSEWTLADAGSFWELGLEEASALLARFGDLSLVEAEAGGGGRSYRIPKVVRSYLQLRHAVSSDASLEQESEALREQAKEVLRGRVAAFDDLLDLARKLKRKNAFGYARRILHLASQDRAFARQSEARRLWVVQQLALCTYKDVDQPADARLDRALEILSDAGDLASTNVAETLGIAGAIHKRKWQLDGQRQHLERSLAYYLRGSRVSSPGAADYDYGYTGINAAFVLDLLASLEEEEARGAGETVETAGSASVRRAQAGAIREQLRVELPRLAATPERQWLRNEWWFLVTIAEACLGLRRYGEARAWIAQARSLSQIVDWELEASARQLAALAYYTHGPEALAGDTEVCRVLSDLVGGNEAALLQARLGKVGLALSGGGFRASLFHIGVLARLAELDVLRSVEVLSCVSGGSIIGAHYYLEVRSLLQRKSDGEVTREDYVDIVRRVANDFLAGVQTNIRTSVTADLFANVRMSLGRGYSRTHRVGELYESRIFRRARGCEQGVPPLDQLTIQPRGEAAGFAPKWHNWRRRAKVPILILNASTLNTGHNWQFTTSFMGEPPGRIDTRIDGNDRLRRMYYREAPPPYQHVRLGHAVAASACVPGLFEALPMPGLYPERVVRLVDGGVHDNQGTAGLLEQDCSLLLVSDASGQMASQDDPGGGVLVAPLRTNTILQSRVRDAQFHELDARRRSSLLHGLMFLHLKKDLDTDPVDWVGCDDPFDAGDEARPVNRRGILTGYGVRKDVQARLAKLRTDLDSFSDLEAFSLMTSGYRMTEHEFQASIEGFPVPDAPPEAWPFLAVERLMRSSGTELARLTQVLTAGSQSAFKLWSLSSTLQRFTRVGAGLVLAAVVLWAWSAHLLTWSRLGWAGLVALLLASGLVALPLNVALCIPSYLSLQLNDWFLRQGKLK